MSFLFAVGLTFLICYFIEPLAPYWFFIFFLCWGILAWIVEQAKQWIELKKYKFKLQTIEPSIQTLNFQNVADTTNAVEKTLKGFQEKLNDGGFNKKNQNTSIKKHLTAYYNFKKRTKKPTKKYRRRYY